MAEQFSLEDEKQTNSEPTFGPPSHHDSADAKDETENRFRESSSLDQTATFMVAVWRPLADYWPTQLLHEDARLLPHMSETW